jgi:predicted nucleic acid-binding protein
VTPPTILDAGPLVAFFDRRDRYHAWAKAQFHQLRVTVLTCEPVVTEACFLLRRSHPGAERELLDYLSQGRFLIPFDLADEAAAVSALMARYANVPMSLADACLVRMVELHDRSRILTLDGDFRIYRAQGKTPIDAILPDDRA